MELKPPACPRQFLDPAKAREAVARQVLGKDSSILREQSPLILNIGLNNELVVQLGREGGSVQADREILTRSSLIRKECVDALCGRLVDGRKLHRIPEREAD